MARPPQEWPIPVYVVELRERVIMTYQVPARLVARRVPAPVCLDAVAGVALVSLCLSNGRCVKPAGGSLTLGSEFHAAELLTPARWQGACRPLTRGNFLLRLFSDSNSVVRLARAALGIRVEQAAQEQGTRTDHYFGRAEIAGGSGRVLFERPLREERWPAGSLYPSAEAAEAHLLHPECYFVPEAGGTFVQAAPVHQYARSTTHAAGSADAARLVAAALQCEPQDLRLDHMFFQKRCTHTWSFPPERISVAHPVPCPMPAGRHTVSA
jgi:hypothetical protein